MPAPPKRPTYFDGQLLSAEDLRAEQRYHLEKRLLLNRHLHGYGVVCGLWVRPAEPAAPHRVRVEPGLALDAAGREIVVPASVELDLSAGRGKRRFVTLEYVETETDPITVPDPDAETSAQPSRIEEGYRLSVRDEPVAAPGGAGEPDGKALAKLVRARRRKLRKLYRRLAELVSRPGPPVPEDCALTLAAVRVGRGPVTEKRIDCLEHRRIALGSARVLEALCLDGRGG